MRIQGRAITLDCGLGRKSGTGSIASDRVDFTTNQGDGFTARRLGG